MNHASLDMAVNFHLMVDEATKAVRFSNPLKSLGDGVYGGYVVLYGSPDRPDLTREYFTQDTDYSLDVAQKGLVWYHHTFDPTIGNRRIGVWDMKADDVGIWAQGQLDKRDAYMAKYVEKIDEMIKTGALGLSSGTASHLVRKKPVGDCMKITHWPLGLDISVTPTPANPDPRNVVVALKSLVDADLHDGLRFDEHSQTALESVKGYVARVRDFVNMKSSSGRPVPGPRFDQFQAVYAELGTLIEAAKGVHSTKNKPNPLALKAAQLRMEMDLPKLPTECAR